MVHAAEVFLLSRELQSELLQAILLNLLDLLC